MKFRLRLHLINQKNTFRQAESPAVQELANEGASPEHYLGAIALLSSISVVRQKDNMLFLVLIMTSFP